jgi:hypothetical protein
LNHYLPLGFQSPQLPLLCGKNNLPYLLIKIDFIIDKCIDAPINSRTLCIEIIEKPQNVNAKNYFNIL